MKVNFENFNTRDKKRVTLQDLKSDIELNPFILI